LVYCWAKKVNILTAGLKNLPMVRLNADIRANAKTQTIEIIINKKSKENWIFCRLKLWIEVFSRWD
jgi:hypothetical protein